jgi:predicted nucleotidyltransferase
MTPQMESLIRQAAAAMIELGAQEVYLFGSAARGSVDAESDVDLAVTGLPPDQFFRAMGRARRILKRPVDLVDLDEATPFTEYLKTSGGLRRAG